MSSKIRIRLGDVELEYEGPEEFLKKELLDLVKAVSALHAAQPAPKSGRGGGGAHSGNSGAEGSVITLARKLGAKKGPDLVVAAALALTNRGTSVFSKTQLRDEMKKATGFYKDSYRSNLDNHVKRLLKAGKIADAGGDDYSIPATEKEKLDARIAAAP